MAKRKVVMTVDDSASVRQMVGFTLTGAGYEVIEAANGLEALEKMERHSVNLVITDVNMPHLNGIELVQRVRSHPSHKFMPIILLTTESGGEKKQEARHAGATGWIVKPFKPDQLLNVIRKVLG